MPLLSRKVDYALLILSYLHHRAEGGCAREIAARFELSRAFTANILKALCQKGFVRSQRGMHGGYVLARPASAVCLCEVLEALDEPFHLAQCNRSVADGAVGACSLVSICPVRSVVAEVDRRIRDVLRAVTLAELFQSAEQPPGGTQFGIEVGMWERDAGLAGAGVR